jgi:carboxyl-terminal processing protease
VPPDAKDDKALKMANDLLHGIKASATTPAPTAVPGDKASNDKAPTPNKAAN